MTYYLGIDLGTTYTAAAVWRAGTVSIASLGNRSSVVPSVVLLRDDQSMLTGEAAARRATTEPHRASREFKRRIGDPTPIIVAGAPYSADALMAQVLRWVVDTVTTAEGGPPAGIAVSYPANWGGFKQDLLRQAIDRADLDDVGPIVTVTEPEAAAIHYASLERVEPGSVIAVYDLGGGTFDAALLRKTDGGWDVLGDPQGIERLGGVDFDEAVFQHVVAATGDAMADLDPTDEATQAALARLRRECVEAKEALSSDTDVSIPVLLPNVQTSVRLTRAEFEQMVRPALADTITTLARAMRSAGVDRDDVDAVLLVGGSSRIPLVSELVSTEIGRPVAVDAHPKHGIALGTAMVAAEAAHAGAAEATVVVPGDESAPPTVAAASPAPGGAAAATPVPVAAAASYVAQPDDVIVSDEPPSRARRSAMLIGGALAVALVVALGIVALTRDDDPGTTAGAGSDAGDLDDERSDDDASDEAEPVTTDVADTTDPSSDDDESRDAPTTEPPTTDAPDDDTGDGTGSSAGVGTPEPKPEPGPEPDPVPDGPFIRLDEVFVDGGFYRADYTVFGFEPLIDGGDDSLHIHLFLDTTTPENAGTDGNPPGEWFITDEPTSERTSFGPGTRGAASQMCVVVANVDHSVHDPASGNCVALP